MADIYVSTSDPNVVEKVTTQEVDLSALIAQYQSLKQEYLNLPDNQKTVPDQETLDFWNTEMSIQYDNLKAQIVAAAVRLKLKVDPIRDAGLLPLQYEDEYQQLVTFITNNS